MNTHRLSATVARCLGVLLLWAILAASRALALPFHIVYDFSKAGPGPAAGLATDGNLLYGTTQSGGTGGSGTVFSIEPDGSNHQILHSFSTGPLGRVPESAVVVDGSTLYGTTFFGGDPGSQQGVVFSMSTSGTSYQVLHAFNSFTGTDGHQPVSNLTLFGSKLYGTTMIGAASGFSNNGVIYSMNADGSNYQILHTFSAAAGGTFPLSALTPVGSLLYGTTQTGGANGGGTLYSINPDGSDFQLVASFPGNGVNSAAANPAGNLTLLGSTLYGVTELSGLTNSGTVYSIDVDGSNFSVLHTFTGGDGMITLGGTQNPGGVTILGSRLYGTTSTGTMMVGPSLVGTGGEIFSMNLDGTGFEIEHLFQQSSSDGYAPYGDLRLFGNVLYGTTQSGGQNNSGTIYALTVPEPSTLLLALIASTALAAWRLRRAGAGRRYARIVSG